MDDGEKIHKDLYNEFADNLILEKSRGNWKEYNSLPRRHAGLSCGIVIGVWCGVVGRFLSRWYLAEMRPVL